MATHAVFGEFQRSLIASSRAKHQLLYTAGIQKY